MKSTQQLHDIGQSLWLDNISRQLLKSGTLQKYRDQFSVTGFDVQSHHLRPGYSQSTDYDNSIPEWSGKGKSGEDLFFELALEDLREAADLFRPIYDESGGRDGFVSLEVSPLLAGHKAFQRILQSIRHLVPAAVWARSDVR